MERLRTGEVARRAGVNLQTIRFYERQRLLPRPPRTPSGYRTFPAEAVQQVRFIKRAQDLGFSLREVRGLLSLQADPDTTCAEVRRSAEEKLADVRARIRDLQRIRRTLLRLVAACPGAGSTTACPVFVTLNGARPSPPPATVKKRRAGAMATEPAEGGVLR